MKARTALLCLLVLIAVTGFAQTPAPEQDPNTPDKATLSPASNQSAEITGHGRGGRNDYPRDRNDGHWRGDRRDRRWRHGWDRGPLFIFHAFSHIVRVPRPIVIPHPVPRIRHSIYVHHVGHDIVGREFAASVREQIRESPDLRLAETPEHAVLELYIVSRDDDPDEPGYSSTVSVSYTWLPRDEFITDQSLVVGPYRLENKAASVVDYAEQLIEQRR